MSQSIKQRTQALAGIKDATGLRFLFEAIRTELVALRALANELHTDHATSKTSHDAVETLIEELHDDHAINKTTIDEARTAVMELIDDADTLVTWQIEVDGDLDSINDYLDLLGQDGLKVGKPGCIDGSDDTTKLRVGGTNLRYQIGGQQYMTTAALETEPPTGEITENLFGAYRMDLNQSGALTVTRKGDPMAYANLEDALISLASVARTANSIDAGYLVIEAAAGGFTAQTDLPLTADAQVTAATYYDVLVGRNENGLNTAATVAAADGVATLNISAINANANGAKLSEIAAAGTQALDDADTVTHTNWGGWLLIVDPAGTGTYCLAADGIAGTVSAMAYADKAAVDTALDLVQERMSAYCVPIARIYLDNTSGADAWTGNTDNWNHDTAVTTVEVYPVIHDRISDKTTSMVRPTIPSTVTAPLNETLTAGDPTASADTLGSSKPASGPGTLTAAATTESLAE